MPFRDRAPQHDYLIRSVDAAGAGAPAAQGQDPHRPAAPSTRRPSARSWNGTASQVLVTKNSGGADGKLSAARSLHLPVIMVRRQEPPPGESGGNARRCACLDRPSCRRGHGRARGIDPVPQVRPAGDAPRLGRADEDEGAHVGAVRRGGGIGERQNIDPLIGARDGRGEDDRRLGGQDLPERGRAPRRVARAGRARSD